MPAQARRRDPELGGQVGRGPAPPRQAAGDGEALGVGQGSHQLPGGGRQRPVLRIRIGSFERDAGRKHVAVLPEPGLPDYDLSGAETPDGQIRRCPEDEQPVHRLRRGCGAHRAGAADPQDQLRESRARPRAHRPVEGSRRPPSGVGQVHLVVDEAVRRPLPRRRGRHGQPLSPLGPVAHGAAHSDGERGPDDEPVGEGRRHNGPDGDHDMAAAHEVCQSNLPRRLPKPALL